MPRTSKFVFNEETLTYEPHRDRVRVKALRALGFLMLSLLMAFGLAAVGYKLFPSQHEERLQRDLAFLEQRYQSLNQELDLMSKVLENVQERDASAHRMVFGMDPIDKDVWASGTGGHDRELASGSVDEMISDIEQRSEQLKRKLVMQSKSLDTILELALDREKMLASIPSIKPSRSDKLAKNIRLLSGFGMRIHPIFKHRKMHTGLDFTAPIGTPVQVTGDGVIESVESERSGYGRHIIVDHGFGFKTLYAHLSSVEVKEGEKVKRGEVIGKVGSSGTSTGPHLHYEVILKGEKVDPIHYCMDGLSPKEYQELVNDASAANQSFD